MRVLHSRREVTALLAILLCKTSHAAVWSLAVLNLRTPRVMRRLTRPRTPAGGSRGVAETCVERGLVASLKTGASRQATFT
jgi:hypothetical protein